MFVELSVPAFSVFNTTNEEVSRERDYLRGLSKRFATTCLDIVLLKLDFDGYFTTNERMPEPFLTLASSSSKKLTSRQSCSLEIHSRPIWVRRCAQEDQGIGSAACWHHKGHTSCTT